ncbi:MAG: Na/Pi cotransporter family protein [Gammaproteobacteria bacterium]|nr:Na/Pi cotransporter family protein [Gammaproteobacteria bacterium]
MSVIQALGGLGLFLLGMIIMTDSLRNLAGDAMRKLLLRFTHTPLSGAVTGTVATAILQSSSATTVAAVGLVGAGLMGFAEALGIIFGANIGTTITGWFVVLLGFKLKIGSVLMPLILVGALLRLFTKDRWASIGMAIAGFGLIFVGIYLIQQGMADLQKLVTPENFPGDTFSGRIKLLLLGILFSAVTQSSSAGVAVTLTALYAGAINFPQAAALVIGMDIGTTVTAALATIGGTVGSRRTGLSHVIYNLFTGTGALFLITPYVLLWQWLGPDVFKNHAEIVLIAFHTSFNILGVSIALPLSHQFARMMERLIPETEPACTRSLDKALLHDPALALTAAQSALKYEAVALLKHVVFLLGDMTKGRESNLLELKYELIKTQSYIDSIDMSDSKVEHHDHFINLFHAMDHIQRLHDRCYVDVDKVTDLKYIEDTESDRKKVAAVFIEVIQDLETNDWLATAERANELAANITTRVDELRHSIMEHVAENRISVPRGNASLDAVRWLDRISGHVARLSHYLADGSNGQDLNSADLNQ